MLFILIVLSIWFILDYIFESKTVIVKIAEFIGIIIFKFMFKFMTIFIIAMPMIGVYLITSIILSFIFTKDFTVYLSSLVVLLLMAYKSYDIINLSIGVLGLREGIISKVIPIQTSQLLLDLNLRKVVYKIAIPLYILFNLISLNKIDVSEHELINLISNSIKEVVLTFLYIDCYIFTFRKNIIDNNENKLKKLKEEFIELSEDLREFS